MQGKFHALQGVLQQASTAMEGHGRKTAQIEVEVSKTQEDLQGTQKHLEGIHLQVADMFTEVNKARALGESLNGKLAQLEGKVQDLHLR